MFGFNSYQPSVTDSIVDCLTATSSLDDTVEKLNDNIIADAVTVVAFVNAHAVNLAQKDAEFHEALINSDLLLRDGIGMKILLKSRGLETGFNANGTDFIPYFLSKNQHLKVGLFGATQQSVDAAVTALNGEYSIVSYENGFHTTDYYLDCIRAADIDILVLGMGMPKQELLAQEIKKSINKPLIVINGGAIIDFIGGTVPRAPLILRKSGMEWLYRLLLEPRRLWRRYISGNFFFLCGVLFHYFKK